MSARLALLVWMVLSAALLMSPSTPAARAQPPAPDHPIVAAVYVSTPPTIDGHLDDPCWSEAARLEGFGCLDVDQPPPEETVALICVDQAAIYLAVICRDRRPEDIVANETRRNGDIWSDDFVWFCLEPWHRHKEGYFFNVTPRGVQCEDIPGGSAAKIEWRGDWRAAAARTAEGWQAEMAIPFAILRYPAGQSSFGFNVGRHFARERVSARYPAEMGITADPSRAADLVGLHPPSPAHRPLLMPYLTLGLGQPNRGVNAGLDVQYTLPDGLTALATLRPDFSQIEDVVEPISFSYSERYLPDPRPFFITGQQGYLPPEGLLYTRRIRDFDTGIKIFGTLGDETIGLLDAVSLGEENAFAAAWRHRFSEQMNSKLLLVSHRQQGEPGNLCYGLHWDYSWRTPEGFDGLWVRLHQSEDEGLDSGGAYAIGGGHYRGVGRVRYDWQLEKVTEGFHPALGYFPEVNYSGGEFNIGRWSRSERGPIEGQGWLLGSYYYPRLAGSGIFRSGFVPGYSWEWRRGRALSLALSRARRDNQDSSDVSGSYAWNTRDMYRSGGIFALAGKRLGGDYHYYSLDQRLRPLGRASLRLSSEYSRLSGSAGFDFRLRQTVLTASYDATPEKCIAARAVWRSNGMNVYAAYRQVVRRGADAYIVVGDPDPSRTGLSRRVLLKIMWTIYRRSRNEVTLRERLSPGVS